MTDDTGTPLSAMERIAALEQRVELLETALTQAFGGVWMEQLTKGENEPTG